MFQMLWGNFQISSVFWDFSWEFALKNKSISERLHASWTLNRVSIWNIRSFFKLLQNLVESAIRWCNKFRWCNHAWCFQHNLQLSLIIISSRNMTWTKYLNLDLIFITWKIFKIQIRLPIHTELTVFVLFSQVIKNLCIGWERNQDFFEEFRLYLKNDKFYI